MLPIFLFLLLKILLIYVCMYVCLYANTIDLLGIKYIYLLDNHFQLHISSYKRVFTSW